MQLVETARCSPVIVPIVGVEAPRSFQGECPLVEELCVNRKLFLSSVSVLPCDCPIVGVGAPRSFPGGEGPLGEELCVDWFGWYARTNRVQFAGCRGDLLTVSRVSTAGCKLQGAVAGWLLSMWWKEVETSERKGHLASMWEKGSA